MTKHPIIIVHDLGALIALLDTLPTAAEARAILAGTYRGGGSGSGSGVVAVLTSTAPTLRDGGESAARQIHDAISAWTMALGAAEASATAHQTIDLRTTAVSP